MYDDECRLGHKFIDFITYLAIGTKSQNACVTHTTHNTHAMQWILRPIRCILSWRVDNANAIATSLRTNVKLWWLSTCNEPNRAHVCTHHGLRMVKLVSVPAFVFFSVSFSFARYIYIFNIYIYLYLLLCQIGIYPFIIIIIFMAFRELCSSIAGTRIRVRRHFLRLFADNRWAVGCHCFASRRCIVMSATSQQKRAKNKKKSKNNNLSVRPLWLATVLDLLLRFCTRKKKRRRIVNNRHCINIGAKLLIVIIVTVLCTAAYIEGVLLNCLRLSRVRARLPLPEQSDWCKSIAIIVHIHCGSLQLVGRF